ncbi:MAG: Ig-like domain-containing protein [Gammaproteobacteria bacterium]
MRKAVWIACYVAVLSLVGCGGGSSGDGSGDQPASEVSGVAFDGLITDADVHIYAFEGAKGDLLGTGKTNAAGTYTIALTAPSQPILIEVTNGRYEEESSDHLVELKDGDRLQAVRFHISGQPLKMAVTYYSTLAAGLAGYLVREQGVTPTDAVELANQRMSSVAGIDIARTMPLDASDPTNKRLSLSPELHYGFLTASLSQWTANASAVNSFPTHETVNSISFIQLALADVQHDGVLDGLGHGGPLAFGTIDLATEVYRHQLAVSLMEYVVSQHNATGLSMTDLRPAIETLNGATDYIFGEAEPMTINFNRTTVADFLPLENGTVFDVFTVSASLASAAELQSVVVELDGAPVEGNVGGPSSPSLDIDSTAYADGPHTLTLVVTNILGETQRFDRSVVIYNAAPSITEIAPADGARIAGLSTFSASVSDSLGVARIAFLVDGSEVFRAPDTPSPQLTIDTTGFADGTHTWSVVATGINGAVRQIDQRIVIVNSPPKISSLAPSSGALLRGAFTARAVLNHPLGIEKSELLIDNSIAAVASIPAAPTFSINGASLLDGAHQISIRATGAITGLPSQVTHTITTDNNGPVVTVADPTSSDVVTNDHLIDPPLNGTQCPCFRVRYDRAARGQGCDFLVRATDTVSSSGQLQLSSPDSTPLTSTRSGVFRGFTAILQPGCRNVAVTVRDRAGNPTVRTVTVCRYKADDPFRDGATLNYCEAR